MRRRYLAPLVLAVALQGATAGAAVPAWTTYRHDGARSGIDPDSTTPVTPTQAWQTPALDGQVYAQPLVYESYVYVATENDTIYKLSAATGAVAWSQHLAAPEDASAAPCGDIAPSIGITSTPVLDPATNRIYAVGATSASGAVRHELFALDADTGQAIGGFPIGVDPPYPSGGAAVNQLQRAGLALDGGRVLIGFGGNDGDCNTYWGWLVSAPANGAGPLSWLQVDASHTEGAIWAAGNAPLLDSSGNAYVATGNGNGNASSDPDYGDSVVKLNPAASPLDWWAPTNWQALDQADADLGSSMPTLLPGGYLLQSGKDGNAYVLSASALGHVSPPAGEVSCGGGSFGGSVYYPANSTVYAACGGIKALSLGSGSPPTLSHKSGFSATSSAAGPPMIAGGLVWATNYSSGTLYGLDPSTGATRSHFPIPENGPSDVNHFASPSAGGGRLFVASGDQVTAFTIAQAPGATATSTTLASSVNPVRTGTAVTLTATVSPPPDGGSVSFSDGGAPIAGCSGVAVSPASAGQALCHATFARSGTHSLGAAYSGDTYYAPSASAPLVESVAAPGAVGPTITRVSLVPRRFTTKHRPTLRLTLSRAATVTVAFTQLRRGHVVRRRCTVKARRGRSCRTHVTLRRLHFHARAGRHAFKLSLGRLKPGHYTVLVYATDPAGRRSSTIRITVTIRAPRAALDGLLRALDSLSL